jgi:exodeoxyribonuclease V gamma subunit
VLILHRSERADQLVAALGRLLADPLGDAVAAEVVAVPTRGVERWITQRLSHDLGAGPRGGGVCANLAFPFPGSLVDRATALATGIDPRRDPWAPERLVWSLIEVIDAHRDDAGLAPLIRHLAAATPPARPGLAPGDSAGEPIRPPRRFAAARHVADLFDRYAVHRPDMVAAWAADRDDGGAGEGSQWQPHLWRLVRGSIRAPSPAERLGSAVARITDRPDLLDLPDRLSVFGLTRLPAAHLAVLRAIAAHRDVHLFLLHPSDDLWRRVGAVLPDGPTPPARAGDPTARLPRHPLLRSWGRDAREMQVVMAPDRAAASLHYPIPEPGAPTVLSRIQADVRADRRPGTTSGPTHGAPALDPSDRSLQIHACHGRTRQVEVLRDALLHLLQADPSLEARDVIVMCPDIETFAPLIHAAFGVDPETAGVSGGGGPAGVEGSPALEDRAAVEDGAGPALRVRLADRSLRQTNPLLAVAAELLALARSRVTAPAVADLAARPPVSRRFSFDQDDVATLERWIAGTAVRWGIDADHRRPWALGGLDANTWAFGLDRLLLGVAATGSGCRVFHRTVPFDALAGGDVELAGRFAEMVDRLGAALDRLRDPKPAVAWIDALTAGTEAMACSAPEESWQHAEMRAALDTAVADWGPSAAAGPDLSLDEVSSLLGDQLKGRPTRANFRTGDLTICTLVPMRSVPHRVVALLGLDDGSFPRHPEADGDDLLLAEPRVGDRDPRSEDRQLLLDALLAATDHLVITYCGRDERTNRRRPPCAPVAELLDVVDATVTTTSGRPARESVVCAHPLQPFDPLNFRPGELVPAVPWSFDPVSLAGARSALAAVAAEKQANIRLPPGAEPVVALEQLVAFVCHPVRAFLRQRLSLYLGDWTDELDDRLPLELDALARWGVGDRLLEATLSGVELDAAMLSELCRGLLPPGRLAVNVLGDIAGGVAGITSVMEDRGFGPGPTEAAQVRFELPDGRTVAGTVPQVRAGTILQCTFSRLGPKQRLSAWVRFLALSADRPEEPVSALSVGKAPRGSEVAVATLPPFGGGSDTRRARALDALGAVVDLYDRGMQGPLPMACKASARWAEGRRSGLDDDGLLARAVEAWESGGEVPGERDDAEHAFLYGARSDLRVLLEERPEPDETGQGWATEERHRFGRLARRLWDPLLAHEGQGGR